MRASDVPGVVDVVNAAAERVMGWRRAAADAVGALRLDRYVARTADHVVAVEGEDAIVGHAYVGDGDGLVVSHTAVSVHPDRKGDGIGDVLVDWAVNRARHRAVELRPGVRGLLQAFVYEQEAWTRRLLERHGFEVVREWTHMVVELEQPPAAPPRAGMATIEAMDLGRDWARVLPAMEEAYADHWGTVPPESAQETPARLSGPVDPTYSNAPGFCFLALVGDRVVGGVLSNARIVERSDTGRVGSMFVVPTHRRQGVGRALMLTALAAFHRAGVRRVVLDTDSASFTGAPQFYRGLGMEPYRRELVLEREVRAGRDVRRILPPLGDSQAPGERRRSDGGH